MATTRLATVLFLGAMVLAIGTSVAAAAPRIEFHWDRGAGSSLAVVKNSDGDVLAETSWPGALPRRYSADVEEAEVPVIVQGILRDQLENSSQPEADEALDFLRDLMGTYADTPVAELSPLTGTWISYSTVSVDEWCGTSINSVGECVAPGNSGAQNALCSESSCKRTTMSPGQ